ncbi:MAG: LysM peptidoglycan-binding domain-containing protein [Bacteroidetes bacterium]|nr:MAG: LysM peptidoglycan-binding domain-containing protein [Bacteroidota bacterium]
MPAPPTFQYELIRERFQTLDCLVRPVWNAEIEGLLRQFLVYGRRDAELMLGRGVMYFPIIEHYLSQYNLPQGMKYLPLVESSMRPKAVSHVGATGLWQFMPATARQFGLRVNHYLDERRDPYKSTEAALRYLAYLYEKYESWELALAAYNAGSGTVDRAIRRAGSTDFWKIRSYLPRETRQYVPKLIVATYIGEYHQEHGLQPRYPDFELQFTRTVKVYHYITFLEIAKATGASPTTLYKLNPGYKKGVIPSNPKGNYLILPEAVVESFRAYLRKRNIEYHQGESLPEDLYRKSTYVVLVGDTLEALARMFDCSEEDIMRWNGLKSRELYYRQELIIYHPRKTPLKERA